MTPEQRNTLATELLALQKAAKRPPMGKSVFDSIHLQEQHERRLAKAFPRLVEIALTYAVEVERLNEQADRDNPHTASGRFLDRIVVQMNEGFQRRPGESDASLRARIMKRLNND